MKKNMYITCAFAVLLDQLTKFLAVKYITNVTIIPNLLSFIYTENKGAAFSILYDKHVILIVSSIILLVALIYIYKKDYSSNKYNNLYNIMYGMAFGGIIGNLLDRIIRGYVVDFISLKFVSYYFPIFNLADMFITISVFLIILHTFKDSSKLTKKR